MSKRDDFIELVRSCSDGTRSWVRIDGLDGRGTAARLEPDGRLRLRLPDGTEIAGRLEHLSIAGEEGKER